MRDYFVCLRSKHYRKMYNCIPCSKFMNDMRLKSNFSHKLPLCQQDIEPNYIVKGVQNYKKGFPNDFWSSHIFHGIYLLVI